MKPESEWAESTNQFVAETPVWKSVKFPGTYCNKDLRVLRYITRV